jgi:hypothetical protein
MTIPEPYEAAFALAARRTEWAALALRAAADELLTAHTEGASVGQVPGHLQAEAGRLSAFLRMIETERQRSASTRQSRSLL